MKTDFSEWIAQVKFSRLAVTTHLCMGYAFGKLFQTWLPMLGFLIGLVLAYWTDRLLEKYKSP